MPDAEDFAAWCEHPCTRFVAAAYVAAAEELRNEWMGLSWREGVCDADALLVKRTRADAYAAFVECGLTEYMNFFEPVA